LISTAAPPFTAAAHAAHNSPNVARITPMRYDVLRELAIAAYCSTRNESDTTPAQPRHIAECRVIVFHIDGTRPLCHRIARTRCPGYIARRAYASLKELPIISRQSPLRVAAMMIFGDDIMLGSAVAERLRYYRPRRPAIARYLQSKK